MADAKLAPNLPDWMLEHANRYLSSGGKEGHLYKMTQPGRPEITVPSLLLTTTGRKSGEKFIFPLFYGDTGKGSYIVVASKGGAPQHPGWYRNLLANPEVEVQVGTAKMKARARTATGAERAKLWQEALKFWPPTPITRPRPSARSRSSCSTRSASPRRNRLCGRQVCRVRPQHASPSALRCFWPRGWPGKRAMSCRRGRRGASSPRSSSRQPPSATTPASRAPSSARDNASTPMRAWNRSPTRPRCATPASV